ncbi:hypothetical protein ACFPC0_10625 [Streptomyces andamanensis]|uniref:Uncharacterized protein n=1 Tax=Streptomyces andamanensis TaxID=1565035 RepID=A0ABV8TCQ6_9ACTN
MVEKISPQAAQMADRLNGYGLVADARADLMTNGPEREAMGCAARLAFDLAQALLRGEEYTPEEFATSVQEIDSWMARAGERRFAARAYEWVAVFSS